MRGLTMGVSLALAGLVWAGSAAAAETKVACIQLNRVFKEYGKTKSDELLVKKSVDGYMQERKDKVANLKAMKKQLDAMEEEAMDPALSDTVRGTKRKEAERLASQLVKEEEAVREFETTVMRQVDLQKKKMIEDNLKEMKSVIAAYARQKSIALVLDSSGMTLNGTEAVVFSEPRLDISDDIIQILNRAPAAPSAK